MWGGSPQSEHFVAIEAAAQMEETRENWLEGALRTPLMDAEESTALAGKLRTDVCGVDANSCMC
jgi:hypothetical protein